jgi:penicillin-binding protein 1A
MELGEQAVIDMARKFGLSSEIPPYPSIHIGAAEVYPIELIAAYSAFANLGVRTTPQAIVRVETGDGQLLWEPEASHLPVMSREEAWLMVNAMRDVVVRGTAAGSVGSQFRYPAAGKTGTTNDGTDVWFIGYTPDLVAGVWMGFDKPQKIKANAQGGALAAPAWTTFMNDVYRRRSGGPGARATPMNIVSREIDTTTNSQAPPYCPATVVATELYIPGTDPIYTCDEHLAYQIPLDTGLVVYPPGTYPPGTYPPGTYPPGTYPPGVYPPPVDTGLRTNPPGGVQTVPPTTRDTIGRGGPPRTVFPRRDSTGRVIPDTTGRRPDTLVRPPPGLPDSINRSRPDSVRPRPDTTHTRPDTTRPPVRPDTTRTTSTTSDPLPRAVRSSGK